ncbi:MAG: hypothetical protein WA581_11030 [Candidatus Acidiferrales bacterium]
MPPEHLRVFGGGASETVLDPVVAIAMIIAIILIVALPRKYVMVPLFVMLFLVPLGEQMLVAGVHLYVFRIVILFGLFRMLWTKLAAGNTLFAGGFNSVDKAFLWCTVCQVLAVIVLFLTTEALINQLGFLLDYLGGYAILRFLLRDEQDLYRALKCFAVLALIIGVCMLWEQFTMRNVFGLIGGIASPEVRDGRIRCQGPFAHQLMAGAFGATLLPLFLILWKNAKAKAIAVIGALGATLIVWTSNSSTSLLALAAGVIAILFWPIRKKMRMVRWGIVAGLVGLQLVMKAPVWFLIAHVDLTGSSSSYQRAALVDQFIRHFWDWWLIGVKSTGSWGWYLWDAQNQYVVVGETGGLIAFILFIALISRSFARLGESRKVVAGDTGREWFLWAFGAALFSNIVAFFGVNYFDQTKFAWFSLLAMISAATAPILQAKLAPKALPDIAFSNSLAHSLAPSHSMARGSSRDSPDTLGKPIQNSRRALWIRNT